MSDVKDQIEKQEQRLFLLLQAVTVMHEQESGHAKLTPEKCSVCNALWRVR